MLVLEIQVSIRRVEIPGCKVLDFMVQHQVAQKGRCILVPTPGSAVGLMDVKPAHNFSGDGDI